MEFKRLIIIGTYDDVIYFYAAESQRGNERDSYIMVTIRGELHVNR